MQYAPPQLTLEDCKVLRRKAPVNRYVNLAVNNAGCVLRWRQVLYGLHIIFTSVLFFICVTELDIVGISELF